MTEAPLIYTKNGNVPVDSVRLVSTFDDNTDIKISFHYADPVEGQPVGQLVPKFDKGGSITIHDKYYDIETGDLVREDAKVLVFKGTEALTGQGTFA
jgi:hypothetical protein